MKFNFEKSIRIGIAIGLVTSLLTVAGTLSIAFFSFNFMSTMLKNLVQPVDYYNYMDIFRHNLELIVSAFLVFGLVFSYYITKIILAPLFDFVRGVKELSEGNFKYRFKKTSYFEINELVKMYNKMAENLQILYDNLESKIQERTKELEHANIELKNTQAMIIHSEKMRSLGQLVAGITHEINNPINFVYGNMVHLQNYTKALLELINLYETYEDDLDEEKKHKLKEVKEVLELDFIKQDLPMLIKSCHEGTERTKNIIIDLKNFSRLDEMVINSIDLSKEIDTTLNILHSKIKNRIEIVKEYDKNIPQIEGYGGQLNQVFMNILDNACYAIKGYGKITIRLQKSENSVIIEFEDTGCGVESSQVGKIFEPFYTTKPVGEGTGLGMSISYKVIQNHNGTIVVDSAEGSGTKFRIQLPIRMESLKAGA